MPWTPTIAATDIRKILGNLLAYLAANQVEALAWASPAPVLTPIAATGFYPTAEMFITTDFPHLGVVKRRIQTDYADDGLRITYSLTIQIEVEATFTKATRSAALLQLQKDTDNYYYAVESMILNIPDATLLANVPRVGHCVKSVTEGDPLERAIGDTRALFNTEMKVVFEFRETPYNA